MIHSTNTHFTSTYCGWKTILTVAFSIFLPVTGIADEQNKEKKSELTPPLPTLDILPKGSILQRVRIPRYDKNYHPTSLLTADKLTVVTRNQIDGENIHIYLYNSKGEIQAQTCMRKASYNQQSSILHATESISLNNKQFKAKGTALFLHIPSKRGFLVGPAFSEFHIKSSQSSTAMRPAHRLHSHVFSTLLITACSGAFVQATPPRYLTPAELSKLDTLAKTDSSPINKAQQQVSRSLSEESKLSEPSGKQMATFLNSIGQDFLIASNQTSATKPVSGTLPSTKPSPSKQATSKPPATKTTNSPTTTQPERLLTVECDGGIYFDADTGVLAYLKNIRLSEPRFRLTCSQELKIILDKKQPQASKTSSNKTKKSKPSTPAKNSANNKETPNQSTSQKKSTKSKSPTDAFGDLSRIIAIGNVRVTRKDPKGNVYIASGETASYDAKSGQIILRGGFPRVQASANRYLQAQEKGLYITISKNGSWIAAKGKWKTLASMPIKQSSQKKKKPSKGHTSSPSKP